MSINEALDYLQERAQRARTPAISQALSEISCIILRAGTIDARRWSEKIKRVVAYVEAANVSCGCRRDAVKLLNKKSYPEWVLCDDDTHQYAFKLSATQYRLVQTAIYAPEDSIYMAYADAIDLADYLNDSNEADEDLTSILNSYGYSSAQHVRDEYGAAANQIMCECIFESYIHERPGTVLIFGSEAECREFVTDYVGAN